MTQNQLTAVRNSEIARNNRALENLKDKEIQESKRHSLATERENQRHNIETEILASNELVERRRSNVANENISYMNAVTNRQNAETNRGNLLVNQQNANVNRFNALTSRLDVGNRLIQSRIDIARNAETIRHNKAVEAETRRNNDLMNSINLERNRIENRQTDIRAQLAGYEAIKVNQGWEQLEINRIGAYSNAAGQIMNGVGQVAKAAAASY